MPGWITEQSESGVTIAVQVIPRARRSEVVGPHGDVLKIRLAAPPVEGAANDALIAFLAAALGLRKRDVSLVGGLRSRRKLIHLQGVDAQAVAARLLPGSA